MKILTFSILITCLYSNAILAEESTCYGTTSNGRLEKGVELPSSGDNFVAYSNVARLAGRAYVHSQVESIIVNAYKSLETEQPDKVFKYAETGFEEGGQFKPIKLIVMVYR
ncbi:hypothetical protein [Colwellia sp. Arc7-635]|uniref:hypothetical protein n=1 Tax=Colwellia sp. Arc7-635 TaxID=2497879 RepID=UPI001F49FF48|nr:hypothetical protein [Colwellia sp. Arc7-635]